LNADFGPKEAGDEKSLTEPRRNNEQNIKKLAVLLIGPK
jgi:hypothetical protein